MRRAKARRVSVTSADDIALGLAYDYVDAFAIDLVNSDRRSAEAFARSALEHAPAPLRWLVWNVFRHVLRFELGPRTGPDHILGWRIVSASQDHVTLRAQSGLFRAVMFGQRPDAGTAKVVTAVAYDAAGARAIWALVGPVHRRVARALLMYAAASGGLPARHP